MGTELFELQDLGRNRLAQPSQGQMLPGHLWVPLTNARAIQAELQLSRPSWEAPGKKDHAGAGRMGGPARRPQAGGQQCAESSLSAPRWGTRMLLETTALRHPCPEASGWPQPVGKGSAGSRGGEEVEVLAPTSSLLWGSEWGLAVTLPASSCQRALLHALLSCTSGLGTMATPRCFRALQCFCPHFGDKPIDANHAG